MGRDISSLNLVQDLGQPNSCLEVELYLFSPAAQRPTKKHVKNLLDFKKRASPRREPIHLSREWPLFPSVGRDLEQVLVRIL